LAMANNGDDDDDDDDDDGLSRRHDGSEDLSSQICSSVQE